MFGVRRITSVVGRRCFSSGSSSSSNSANGINNTAAMAAAAGFATLLLFGRGGNAVKTEAVAVPEAVVITPESSTTTMTENTCDVSGLEERIKTLEKEFSIMQASATNEAFVFIKPHAVTDSVKALVSKGFQDAGIKIKSQGTLTHDVIDEKKLIDTHYGAIASKAVSLKPNELNVPQKGLDGFQKMFGEEWKTALENGNVYNAADAAKKLGINGSDLDKKWGQLERGKNLIKFGGGFYCGKVDDIYVMNGFYMAMRDKYCAPPSKIHYYVVEWNPSLLSWEDFRGKVLGGTDPNEAASGSLRRIIFEQWETLGLESLPNVGDNGVHASASPFEAAAERQNWTGQNIQTDKFGKAALALGIPEKTLQEWMGDAQVTFEDKKQSIFDCLEDLNTDEVLEKLQEIAKSNL